MPLPNLFVIGAAKSGTTSLHYYLAQHPEIEMTRDKEPHLFLGPDWRARLESYAHGLRADVAYRGEASTGYSVYPRNPHVPARIAELVPDARLVYLVRDPVDRAIAHYHEAVRQGEEPRGIDAALRDDREGSNPYLAASRYALQAGRYLERFDSSQLLVIDHDRLLSERERTLAELFGFLGVDAGFSSTRFDRELGRSSDSVAFGPVGQRLRESRPGRLVRALPLELRGPLVRLGRRALGHRIEGAKLDPALRAELAEALREDAHRLRALTGEPFAGWSV